MKKTAYLIIPLVLFCVLPAYTQSSDFQTNKVSVGIIGGINIADMHLPNSQGPDDQRISSLLRFGAGAVLDIHLSEHINARIEPMYLQKGGKIEEGTDPVNQPEGYINSSSIELPLFIQYFFGNGIKPYLIAGPTIGYNLKSEIDFSMTGLDFIGDMKEITTTFDLGIAIGGGIQMPVSIGKIFLEGRYSYGLMNQRESGTVILESSILQIEMDADKEDDKYTNRGVQIMLGITFPL